MIPSSFAHVYADILDWVLRSREELNERTQTRIRVGRGGTAFSVDLSQGILPTIGLRKTFPKTAAAEMAWFLLGRQSTNFIATYTPMWNKFVDELGPNDFGVTAAYGYRWRRHFGRDQLQEAMTALRRDPSDRRCYISAWDPANDGCGVLNQKNVPCPVGFSLSIQGDELHSTLTLRSSDVFVGLPYDVMGHALLMSAVASELKVMPGILHVALAHVHLYESHWEMAAEAMRQTPVVPRLLLPGWSVSQIVDAPDEFVTKYGVVAARMQWPEFNPRPNVVV